MFFTAWKKYTKETDKGKSIYCGRMRFGDSMAINNILYKARPCTITRRIIVR